MNSATRLPGTPEPMHRWEGADGIHLAADSWGDPKGPLVILQHGGGQTRHAWKGTGEKLASAGYHVVAFDARGHGDSDWTRDGHYSGDAMVQDLKRIVAILGKPRPVLVGASMGGGTSLLAVGEDHVDATALILVDVAPRVEPDGVKKIQEFMGQKSDGFNSLEEVAQAIGNYQPHRPRPRNLDGLVKNVRVGADGKFYWHWDPRFLGSTSDFEKRYQRFRSCAQNLKLPTLLVRGGLSDVLTEEGVQEFLSLCPHSEFVSVEGAAHMVAGDRNDAFGSSVIEFLGRTVPVGGDPVHPPHELRPHHEGPEGELGDIP